MNRKKGQDTEGQLVKVFLGGLHKSWTNDDIYQIVLNFGEVAETKVIRDSDHNSKGFGFATIKCKVSLNELYGDIIYQHRKVEIRELKQRFIFLMNIDPEEIWDKEIVKEFKNKGCEVEEIQDWKLRTSNGEFILKITFSQNWSNLIHQIKKIHIKGKDYDCWPSIDFLKNNHPKKKHSKDPHSKNHFVWRDDNTQPFQKTVNDTYDGHNLSKITNIRHTNSNPIESTTTTTTSTTSANIKQEMSESTTVKDTDGLTSSLKTMSSFYKEEQNFSPNKMDDKISPEMWKNIRKGSYHAEIAFKEFSWFIDIHTVIQQNLAPMFQISNSLYRPLDIYYPPVNYGYCLSSYLQHNLVNNFGRREVFIEFYMNPDRE